jgi:hypothetical protein
LGDEQISDKVCHKQMLVTAPAERFGAAEDLEYPKNEAKRCQPGGRLSKKRSVSVRSFLRLTPVRGVVL